jgi:DNA-binding transcriptional MerR regulator
MNTVIPDKNYFRIGEVSKILGVESYVVRYWESEFKSVKPIRTKSGQRLYRRKDVEELLTIKNLLYVDMFTIAGARKRLLGIKRKDACSGDEYCDILDKIEKELMAVRKIVG